MHTAYFRFACILISSIFLSSCYKRKSTQEALTPLEFLYADQLVFDETSRDTLRSAPIPTAKVSSHEKTKPLSRNKIRAEMRECQARLGDIPAPLHAMPLERYFYSQDNQVILGYDVHGHVSDYVLFYEQGLERSGWRNIAALSAPFETLLIYEKPERFCIISLRHAEAEGNIPVRIMIYAGVKDENS